MNDAEDALQTTIMNANKTFDIFEEVSNFKAWISGCGSQPKTWDTRWLKNPARYVPPEELLKAGDVSLGKGNDVEVFQT